MEPVPPRVTAETKEGLLKLIDDATAQGWSHVRATDVLGVADVRVHRWRNRLRVVGTLVDRAPGGNPVHRLLAWEEHKILDLIEEWGPTDRSHRKIAHRGSYLGRVWVAPSTVRRVAAKHQVTLPEPASRRSSVPSQPWPDTIEWRPNQIWMWDATGFGRARRHCVV
ncbi:MAG: integrase core domain-containing protein, partial [Acidimicrobiia bacterium]